MACGTDASCAATRDAAAKQIEQNNADIASYQAAIADIEKAIDSIYNCTQDLDCVYNNITSAVNDSSFQQQFQNISTYSEELTKNGTSYAAQKAEMETQIAALEADNAAQIATIRACGNCIVCWEDTPTKTTE